jgi:hypothetical protein
MCGVHRELELHSLVVGVIRNQPGEVPSMSLLKASLVCTALGAGMLALSGVNASADRMHRQRLLACP